jgi:pimeloyl-ACP methyl ester carboxylesterase
VPELAVASGDFAFIRGLLRDDGMSGDAIQPYVDAARVPGALTAMIHYYRAAVRDSFAQRGKRRALITCPVLVLWGDGDRYLGTELAEPPVHLVPDARVIHLPRVSHWVQNAAPDEVNAYLLEFTQRAEEHRSP